MAPRRTSSWRRLAAIGAAGVVLAACTAKPKNFDNENDDLRRKLIAAEDRADALAARNAELEAQLAEAARRLGAAEGEPAADVIASIPRCAGVRFGALTGIDPDDPGVLTAYLIPFDGRRRFVQVAGGLTLAATLIPGQRGDARPRALGDAVLRPPDLREAYRSSPLGTHYTVRVPLRSAVEPGSLVALRVWLDDAVSGRTHEAHTVVTAP